MNNVTIIGAGLAGCEAALQLVAHGFNVKLYDSKPKKRLPIYNLTSYAELVCNSSFGNIDTSKPLGLLLYELKLLGSKLVNIAENCRVEDKLFFAIDKKGFSKKVSNVLKSSGVKLYEKHVKSIPHDDYVIIATGPLTDRELLMDITQSYNIKKYHFLDASSPIIDIKSVDLSNTFIKKITDDLYCLLLSDTLLKRFFEELINIKFNLYAKDNDGFDYENCLSLEKLAKDGLDKLVKTRLVNDYTEEPSILLRRENGLEDGYILVGCMTTMKNAEQRRIFSMLPGCENIRFIKYGRMHRNTFFHSPGTLNSFYQIINTNVFIVGQLSGIDGYTSAISSGLIAATKIIYGNKTPLLPTDTIIGGLAKYISNPDVIDFQPMCASFSLIEKESTCDYLKVSRRSVTEYKKSIDLMKRSDESL